MTDLKARFLATRRQTEALTAPLSVEDYVVQSMPDASPVKWHLAHTTWFFETFVVAPNLPTYQPREPAYAYLFNSYYQAVGPMFERASRGVLSRPLVAEVKDWRAEIDDWVVKALAGGALDAGAQALVELGIHHEQQHQELMVVDLKHALMQNPLDIAITGAATADIATPAAGWLEHEGGLIEIGHAGQGFAFDNEGPRHTTFVAPFRLAKSPVTCGEYLEFMTERGYERSDLWLSDAWEILKERKWRAPLYWQCRESDWVEGTLGGRLPVNPNRPVSHISFFEADAFARWRGKRLPTEQEWEHAASLEVNPSFGATLETGDLHPTGTDPDPAVGLQGLFGDVWEWTASPYRPYPGYRAPAGAVGEYNGKFMNGQYVLRGGSCATPRSHIRSTYRNFFAPDKRWNFMGLRLADDEETR